MKLHDYEVPKGQEDTDLGLYINMDKLLGYNGVIFGGGSFSLACKRNVDEVDGTEWFSLRSSQRWIQDGKHNVDRLGINLTRSEIQELVNELNEVLKNED